MEQRSLYDKVKGVIELLNQRGFDVVMIADEFYVPSQFQYAQGTTVLHYLSGKDITTLITRYADSHVNNLTGQNLVALEQSIHAAPIYSREYCKSFPWRVFKAGMRQ